MIRIGVGSVSRTFSAFHIFPGVTALLQNSEQYIWRSPDDLIHFLIEKTSLIGRQLTEFLKEVERRYSDEDPKVIEKAIDRYVLPQAIKSMDEEEVYEYVTAKYDLGVENGRRDLQESLKTLLNL